MSTLQENQKQQYWSGAQVALFRIVFIFLLLLTIPLDWGYYKKIGSINLSHFQDVFLLTAYVPRLVHFSDWGIASYAGWGIALIITIIGAFIWGAIKKEDKEYSQLYYWLRVIIRYRLALGLIGYGVIKLFPVQLPHPTISDLNTPYGDFLPWKIYYLSTGVASAGYEQTLGAIEIFAGLLLLYRRTAVVGAGIALAILTNIVLANFAYQIGEHVYSVYLLLLSLFVLAYDTPRLYNLLVKERLAVADHFKPAFTFKNAKVIRTTLKTVFLLFAVFYAGITYAGYKNSKWPFPDKPGLKNAAGIYNVQEFKINGTELLYSATDTTRWQDVVFEKWDVLSVRANRHYPIDLSSPEIVYQENDQRNYESKGNGGRAFYNYTVTDSTIRLTNKNFPSDIETFKISRPDSATIVLKGINAHKDSLYVVLNKLNKKYLLDKGRRKAVSIY